jgi:glycosyltransferase involved in cell wall biosynthesis
MSNIFLVDLESVETRYTGQWKSYVPELLKKEGHNVQVIPGPADIPSATTPGAFLNFGGTNIYKSVQVEQISRLFCAGSVRANDHFIFTDAWHPGIINLKYMSELLNIPVKIHALWHAGSYDPQDFLGRLIGNAPWVRHAEQSFFHAIDHNYFATDFHIKLFTDVLLREADAMSIHNWTTDGKIIQTGWPMDYMDATLQAYKGTEKQNLIVFPHRIAPEKQVEIFRDLKQQLPEYEFVVCQDQQLTKNEYHNILGQAKIVFSGSLQETLGIGCYEGAIVDAIPMVPNRLSYSEMYLDEFKYPSVWTIDYDNYTTRKKDVCDKITDYIENYESYLPALKKQTALLTKDFFSAGNLLRNLK